MKDVSTQELVNIIHREATAALRDDKANLGANEAIDEIEARNSNRGKLVRLSNLENDKWMGKYYVCGIIVDGVITNRFKQFDLAAAKGYTKAF